MPMNTDVYDQILNPILEKATNEELDAFVELLLKQVTCSLTGKDAYKAHQPDHSQYVDLIAADFREFGGNSMVNPFRGEGPKYREIVCDVADKVKAPYSSDYEVARIEDAIVEKVLKQAIEKMSEEELSELIEEMGRENSEALKAVQGPAAAAAIIAVFRAGGFKSYQITLIVVNAIWKVLFGHGLKLAGNAALAKYLGILAGPIGWAITGIWTALDVAGPAYRVTIPGVLYVAMLRKKYMTPTCPHCKNMISPDAKFCSECGKPL